ncbi:Methyltransferase type 11 (plasmid) [Rhodoferax ferrireducens T118]|uniref:Methyltransferase type 11 n=2 Tax=Rhodoferax ferrireducens TaxID=192843 RepID=Q21QC2_ALBFT|nr:Methyltransferase type 11 [Rhodoferax ferrireducens T118]
MQIALLFLALRCLSMSRFQMGQSTIKGPPSLKMVICFCGGPHNFLIAQPMPFMPLAGGCRRWWTKTLRKKFKMVDVSAGTAGLVRTSCGEQAPEVEDCIVRGATVVDCGCYGWRLAAHCTRAEARLIGVDQLEPPGRPVGTAFACIHGLAIDLDDDVADVVVASHILEHVQEPTVFMLELMRITKPGGVIWIEAPSELSALINASSDSEDHSFLSFWDDPTHVRPWTPGALYRLALSCQCVPVAISRCNAGGIPSSRMVGRKPMGLSGLPSTRYVSLRDVEPGLSNAWHHVWGSKNWCS